jgi:hypothetical protein
MREVQVDPENGTGSPLILIDFRRADLLGFYMPIIGYQTLVELDI